MGRVSGLVRILEHEEMELVHRSALRVLNEVGMRIEHLEALQRLEAIGCRVEFDRQIVRFPPEVVEDAVSKLRRDFDPARASLTREPTGGASSQRYAHPVPMRYTAMYFSTMPRRIHHRFIVNTGGFPPFVYDLEG